ncbi:IS982 family transposase [Pseudoalteromonas peptidolytica]|uniref:Transposase DDE domain-containing protein n=3 Tax=Pseudoalteromonas peptidolytica TaxID=61150 RepID=A0A8I0MUG6_9GAMM|nr:IS982 family transposase [Pseudoalteromonas peptidolytica]MBE0345389.1 hypothetical protein [Pseudoalteromonas peptidolytica F12-50-A1]MBE0345838.1 hypothetical protein [Pseudoalteromonas peptidolytica F12-50-A1]MBE0346138.1 hypothetical protein [Pseudoalteromonas peptidolytica F12-50-A1]NLR17286.1 IS982 family transposase [Pseudoalteromonas peptidolytica]
MNKLVELFCDVDDFCKVFLPQWHAYQIEQGQIKRERACQMSMAEIMTVIILFHMSNQRDFKNFYKGYLARFHKKDFPTLLSYTRFLELMPRAVTPLSSYFKTLKSTDCDICFIDSTSIKVCHNLRIPRHKTFAGVAKRGRGTMGWYFGFKLHLIINHKGEIIAAKVTPANKQDTAPVEELTQNLTGTLYGDKGYISSKLEQSLSERGLKLVTNVRSNMKAKAISAWDKAMLSKRFIIETVIDQLKNICQLEHSRHRSLHGMILTVLGALIAYSHKEKKPSISIDELMA